MYTVCPKSDVPKSDAFLGIWLNSKCVTFWTDSVLFVHSFFKQTAYLRQDFSFLNRTGQQIFLIQFFFSIFFLTVQNSVIFSGYIFESG